MTTDPKHDSPRGSSRETQPPPVAAASPPIETVRKIASLARLDLAVDEEAALAGHFGRILEHFRILEKLDVSGVEAMLGASRVSDVLRADVPAPSLPVEAMLANAPVHSTEFYVVPKTVGGEA